MSEPQLYGLSRETGPRVDDLLRAIAARLRDQGLAVAGYVQERLEATECGCPGIVLHDLASGAAHDISEKRGPGASGCNLDWGALTQRAADLERSLGDTPPALLIISRFGKAELEGRGFCSVIAKALEHSVPVLVAYRAGFAAGWQAYHGGVAQDLAGQDIQAILRELGLCETKF
ncbi:MAG: DUF2478 domain-containing protein [Mangrovicoccus sp.]|nr:DUF2478 domain-containing protein [Mangrovicoccus sp.]